MNSKKFLLAMIIFTALLLVVAIVYTAVIANRDGDTTTSGEPAPSDEPSAPSDPTDDLTDEPITPPVSDDGATSDESDGDISSPPPVTEPPVTEPPATEPPVTDPPETLPPVTDEVTTGGGDDATYPPAFGRIISQNDYKIKLIVDWEVISRNADEAKIKITLKLQCYSLTVSPRDKYANAITVGGKSYGFTSPRIDSGAVSKTEYLLDTVEITMPLVNGQGSVEVSASWLFNGNYAGEQIKYVTAEGIISLEVN